MNRETQNWIKSESKKSGQVQMTALSNVTRRSMNELGAVKTQLASMTTSPKSATRNSLYKVAVNATGDLSPGKDVKVVLQKGMVVMLFGGKILTAGEAYDHTAKFIDGYNVAGCVTLLSAGDYDGVSTLESDRKLLQPSRYGVVAVVVNGGAYGDYVTVAVGGDVDLLVADNVNLAIGEEIAVYSSSGYVCDKRVENNRGDRKTFFRALSQLTTGTGLRYVRASFSIASATNEYNGPLKVKDVSYDFGTSPNITHYNRLKIYDSTAVPSSTVAGRLYCREGHFEIPVNTSVEVTDSGYLTVRQSDATFSYAMYSALVIDLTTYPLAKITVETISGVKRITKVEQLQFGDILDAPNPDVFFYKITGGSAGAYTATLYRDPSLQSSIGTGILGFSLKHISQNLPVDSTGVAIPKQFSSLNITVDS